MIPNFENIKSILLTLYTRSPGIYNAVKQCGALALLFPDFRRLSAFFTTSGGFAKSVFSAPCTSGLWLAHFIRFRTTSTPLRYGSATTPPVSVCQRTTFRKSRKNSGSLSRLRPQPVPLWAFLMLLMQRYGEYLILPNISATFFKQIFKLSYKALKHKYLQRKKVLESLKRL